MDRAYLELLPQDLRELVGEIEAGMGLEIVIEVDPARAVERPNEADRLACSFDGRQPIVLIPAPGHFPESSVLHELLHIRRFCVEGVPQLSVCDEDWDPGLESGMTAIDNDLEHLIIVPNELARRPHRRAGWIGKLNAALDRLNENGIHPTDRNSVILRVALLNEHVLCDAVTSERLQGLILAHDLALRNEMLLETVLSQLTSKENMCRACIEPLALQGYPLCLHYMTEEASGYQERL